MNSKKHQSQLNDKEGIESYGQELNLPKNLSIERDPVEDTEEFKKVEKEVDAQAEEMAKAYKGMLGYCHKFWYAKKKILKEKYGIDWHTPAEICPWIHYD